MRSDQWASLEVVQVARYLFTGGAFKSKDLGVFFGMSEFLQKGIFQSTTWG